MNYLRKMKKNAKALSPVVASIILIAVTVAVSIAVAAWMGQMTTGFMQTEQLTLRDVAFNSSGTYHYNLTVANTGTSAVVVSGVSINGVTLATTNFGFNTTQAAAGVSPYTIQPNNFAYLSVTAPSPLVASGNNYQIVVTTSKNNQFSVTAVAPA